MSKTATNIKIPDKLNHRTRVGQQRREQTEARILQAAVNVFATKPIEEAGVNDFIREAQVSRGTFYNHYRTNEELLAAVINWLHSDLSHVIEEAVEGIANPLHRLSVAMRIFYRKAKSDVVWAELMCARMLGAEHSGTGMRRDLIEARKQGLVRVSDVELGVELMVGTVLCHVRSNHKQKLKVQRKHKLVHMILRGLGADDAHIEAALKHPLPAMHRKPHSFRAAHIKKKR